jgi:predicted deacetylase
MKTVILSVHDVTPRFASEIDVIMEHFREVPTSILVTPLWDGWHRFSADFVDILRGSEKVLHGLTHRSDGCDWMGNFLAFSRRSDREFYNLSRQETFRRLDMGKRLFEQAFSETPTGFVPPTWYHNSHSIELLTEMGFGFTETAQYILNLTEKSQQNAVPICLDYGNNRLLESFLTYGWRWMVQYSSPDLVRLSIHPSDVTNGFLPHFDTMIQILKDKNYRFTTYQNFLNYNNLHHAFNNHLHTERGEISPETLR